MAQNFKVGDKVRLTGSAWGETLDHQQGDIVEVLRLDYEGLPVIKGGWIANEGGRWSTELVTDQAVAWIEQDDWDSVEDGVKVRLTNGDNVYVGKLRYNYGDGNLDVNNGKTQLDAYKSDGWKLEVEKPAPTTLEPGFYTYSGNPNLLFRVREDGTIQYTNAGSASWINEFAPETLRPNLVRLPIPA